MVAVAIGDSSTAIRPLSVAPDLKLLKSKLTSMPLGEEIGALVNWIRA